MANPKSTSKRRPARKPAPRRTPPKNSGYRNAVIAVGILLAGVLIAALAVRVFWPPRLPAPPVAVAPKPRATVKLPAVKPKVLPGAPSAVRPKQAGAPPPYEVFPSYEEPGRKIPPPDRPPAGRPRVALVIDDLGYDPDLAEAFLSLDIPLTVAVLPFSPYKNAVLKAARHHGKPVMLHLPMEPEEYPRVQPGPGALTTEMTPDELIAQLREDLADVPAAIGVNNHMGSRLTRDSGRLNQVFSILKERGLFFIDSRTTDKTLGYQSARLLKVPFAQRDVFLDHRQEEDFIRRQIEVLMRRAEENGQAVGIGHPYAVTLDVLRESLPEMLRRVDLVPAAALVRTVP